MNKVIKNSFLRSALIMVIGTGLLILQPQQAAAVSFRQIVTAPFTATKAVTRTAWNHKGKVAIGLALMGLAYYIYTHWDDEELVKNEIAKLNTALEGITSTVKAQLHSITNTFAEKSQKLLESQSTLDAINKQLQEKVNQLNHIEADLLKKNPLANETAQLLENAETSFAQQCSGTWNSLRRLIQFNESGLISKFNQWRGTQDQCPGLGAEINHLKETLNTNRSKINTSTTLKPALEESIKALQGQKANLEETVANITSQLSGLQQELQNKTATLSENATAFTKLIQEKTLEKIQGGSTWVPWLRNCLQTQVQPRVMQAWDIVRNFDCSQAHTKLAGPCSSMSSYLNQGLGYLNKGWNSYQTNVKPLKTIQNFFNEHASGTLLGTGIASGLNALRHIINKCRGGNLLWNSKKEFLLEIMLLVAALPTLLDVCATPNAISGLNEILVAGMSSATNLMSQGATHVAGLAVNGKTYALDALNFYRNHNATNSTAL